MTLLDRMGKGQSYFPPVSASMITKAQSRPWSPSAAYSCTCRTMLFRCFYCIRPGVGCLAWYDYPALFPSASHLHEMFASYNSFVPFSCTCCISILLIINSGCLLVTISRCFHLHSYIGHIDFIYIYYIINSACGKGPEVHPVWIPDVGFLGTTLGGYFPYCCFLLWACFYTSRKRFSGA